jgi:hypothetical protein
VLPAPDKCFRPNQPKNSAAHNIISYRLFYKDFCHQIVKKLIYLGVEHPISSINQSVYLNKKVRPLLGHFMKNLQEIRPQIFSDADILSRPLLSFAAKFLPVGNTVTNCFINSVLVVSKSISARFCYLVINDYLINQCSS